MDNNDDMQYENEFQAPDAYTPETPKMVGWVIKYSGGLVKTEQQANYVLLAVIILAITISLFVLFGGGSSAPPVVLPPSAGELAP